MTISHSELKRRAVLTVSNVPETGKVFNNLGIYKVWDGRTYLNIGDAGIGKMFDSITDFPPIGERGLLYRLRVPNHYYIWDGSGYVVLGGNHSRCQDFIAAGGQVGFIILNEIVTYGYLYINGIKIQDKPTNYSFSNDGVDTLLTLGTPATADQWISIEYEGA